MRLKFFDYILVVKTIQVDPINPVGLKLGNNSSGSRHSNLSCFSLL